MTEENNKPENIEEKKPIYKQKKGIIGIIIGVCCLGILVLAAIGMMFPDATNIGNTGDMSSNSSSAEQDADKIITDILDVKNVKLDKYTFNNPENFDNLFQVELSKHNFKQIEFLEIKKETYDNYINDVENNAKSTNVGEFTGYLLTINNEYDNVESFSYVFTKDDKYYEISSVDGTLEWNNHVENDITILLEAWNNN